MLNWYSINPAQLAIDTAKKAIPAKPSTPPVLQSSLNQKVQQPQAISSNMMSVLPKIWWIQSPFGAKNINSQPIIWWVTPWALKPNPITPVTPVTQKQPTITQQQKTISKEKIKEIMLWLPDREQQKEAFQKILDRWYTIEWYQPEEKQPTLTDKLKTNPITALPTRAVWWTLWVIWWAFKWLKEWIVDWGKDAIQHAKEVYNNPNKGRVEKLAEISLAIPVAEFAWWAVGDVIWWAIEWGVKWQLTQNEQQKVKDAIPNIIQKLSDTWVWRAVWDKASLIQSEIAKLSPEWQKRVEDYFNYALEGSNLIWLWLAKAPIAKGFKALSEWITKWVAKWVAGDVVEWAVERWAFSNLLNNAAKRLLNSSIKITDTNKKAIVKASGKDWTEFALENDIIWSVDDMITKSDDVVNDSMTKKLKALESVKWSTPITQTEKIISNSITTQAKKDLAELYGKGFDEILPDEIVPELQDIFNIIKNIDDTIKSWKITASKKEALKSLYDAYNSHLKYDPAKSRILSWAEKIRLWLQEQIETIGKSIGVDIKSLNKKIAWAVALKKWLTQAGNRMDNLNLFWLWDSQMAILSAALWGTPVQVLWTIIGKWILESPWIKSKLAKFLYTKWLTKDAINSVPSPRVTASSNISKQFAGSNTVSNSSKVDDVKLPKTPPIGKSPKPKVTPVIPPKATVAPSVSVPKKWMPKLWKEIMEQDISQSDNLISEAKKYKTADEFVNKQDIVYHWTNNEFDNFQLSTNKTKRASSVNSKAVFFADDKNSVKYYGKNIKWAMIDKSNLFDYKNPDHIKELERYLEKYSVQDVQPWALFGKDSLMSFLKKGDYWLIESKLIQSYIKKKWFDGFIANDYWSKDVYWILNLDKIKTESQLKQIREQANKPSLPKPKVPWKWLGKEIMGQGIINNRWETIQQIKDRMLKQREVTVAQNLKDIEEFWSVKKSWLTQEDINTIQSTQSNILEKEQFWKSIRKRVNTWQPLWQKKNMIFDYDWMPVKIVSFTDAKTKNSWMHMVVQDYWKWWKTITLSPKQIAKIEAVWEVKIEKIPTTRKDIDWRPVYVEKTFYEHPFTKERIYDISYNQANKSIKKPVPWK